MNNNLNFDDLIQTEKPRSKGFAIASLICGIVSIFSCCCILYAGIVPAVLAIVFFAIDKAKYKTSNGLAIAGLVLGIIGTVISLLLIVGTIIISSNPEFSSIYDSVYDSILEAYND